jgi:hypothetical protein
MSLALAAKHLESQGRGKDTHLVHMTPNELKALNKLSLDHLGQPLSKNPKTGLPEAGFLDAIVPTVLGAAGAAFAPASMLPWIAGGVGLLSYAMTGDIGQGIMAGLGAWSGGKLAGDIKSAANLAQSGGNSAVAAADAVKNAALDTSVYTPINTMGAPSILGKPALIDTTGGLANIGAVGTTNAAGQTIAPEMARQVASSGFSAPPMSEWDQFTTGLQGIKDQPGEFFARDGVKWNTAMALSPLALEALKPNYGKIPNTTQDQNPFGLKRLSPDFKGSFPTQPNPYYTAQYPDYRARPYGMNDGGLADVEKYAKGRSVDASKILRSSEDVMSGISAATKRPMMQIPERPDVGIYEDERKYAGLDPYERSLAVLKDIKKSTGMSTKRLPDLESVGTLGAINTEPALSDELMAQQAQQQILNDYYKSAKSGGIMHSGLGDYSDGGRLLKGPGDGVSDSIPASIAGKQPARLAEGEFVIPARIVSELGNGSTDAGAKRLYDMMDRVKAKRRKAKDIAADTKAYKLLPA